MTTATARSLITAHVQRVASLAVAHAEATESARTLAPEVVTACEEARLFSALVPRAYGGHELDPLAYIDVVQDVSAADASAGWCVNIAATTGCLSWFFPPDTAAVVWGSASATGGSYAVNGTGVPRAGGWDVTGRWAWGSGSTHCAWLSAGYSVVDGKDRVGLVEKSAATMLDTWHSAGLRGTASTDWTLESSHVADGYSISASGMRPTIDTTLARMPMFSVMASGIASVALGIARRAISELELLAGAKTPFLASRKLAEHPPAQLALAEATARHRAARVYLADALSALWDDVVCGDQPSIERRADLRLAAHHAATEAARAVDLCFHAGGGSAVYETSPLQRCFRDVHTGLAHILVSDRNALTYAKVALGLPTNTAML